MSKLERAFAEAAKLSSSDQDALAEWILQELASEREWAKAFERSQAARATLAEVALTEHRAGHTRRLH